MSLILADLKDSIATITFNNGEKGNCLSTALLEEFMTALQGFEEQKALTVILRAAKGAKIWSAGLDINELPSPAKTLCPTGIPWKRPCAWCSIFLPRLSP